MKAMYCVTVGVVLLCASCAPVDRSDGPDPSVGRQPGERPTERSVAVRILWPDKRPAPGRIVEVRSPWADVGLSWDKDVKWPHYTARTDQSGRCNVSVPARWETYLFAAGGDWSAASRVKRGSDEVTMILRRHKRVCVFIVDDRGRPAKGVRVGLMAGGTTFSGLPEGYTNDAGTLTLEATAAHPGILGVEEVEVRIGPNYDTFKAAFGDGSVICLGFVARPHWLRR